MPVEGMAKVLCLAEPAEGGREWLVDWTPGDTLPSRGSLFFAPLATAHRLSPGAEMDDFHGVSCWFIFYLIAVQV